MRTIELSKQLALDDDPKGNQQICFTRNLNQFEDVNENTTIFVIILEAKKTIIVFSQENAEV